MISIEVKIGLLIGKTNQVECGALLCEGAAEEVVLFVVIFDLDHLVGTSVCLTIIVVLFSGSASARLLERVVAK